MNTTPIGAADEARTRYLHLGKVALYQMSYGRILVHLPLHPRAILANFGPKRSKFCGEEEFQEFCHRGLTRDPDRARTDDPQRDRLVL